MECCYESGQEKSLAMAYVPWQRFIKVMDADDGLTHGTIFEELVMPFYGTQAACTNNPQMPHGNHMNQNMNQMKNGRGGCRR